MNSIKGRTARASLWITFSRAATNICTTLSTIVLARLLMPTDFGLVALAMSIVIVLSALTETSMASALIHLKEPTEDHYHTAFTLGLARGVVLAIALALLAGPVSDLYDEPRLEAVLYVLTVNVLLTGLVNPRLVMLQKQLIFRQMFYIAAAQALVSIAVSITLAVTLESYWALVIGTLAGQATNVIVSYLLFPFRPRLSSLHFRELWSFSIWLALGQMVNTVNFRFDHLLIGGYLGRGALGHYSVGSNLATVPSREAVVPLSQSLFPAFSLVREDKQRLRRAYQRAQATVTALALPAGIGFALVADPLIRLAMGEKWAPAILVVQAISSLYALQTLGRLSHPLAMALGATQFLFRRSVQIFLIRLPLVAVGMYVAGLEGVLLGRVIAGGLAALISMQMVSALVGLPLLAQIRINLRTFAAALAMIGAVVAVQAALPPAVGSAGLALQLAASVAAGGAAFLAAIWLAWLAAGRPEGVELEALGAGRKAVALVRGRLGRGRSGGGG